MSLNLSDEDQQEYTRQYMDLAARRDHAAKEGFKDEARRCRQQISRLYDEFKLKEIPTDIQQSRMDELRFSENDENLAEGVTSLREHEEFIENAMYECEGYTNYIPADSERKFFVMLLGKVLNAKQN